MKQQKPTLATILVLLFGMSLQAQNFVTGSNLNIGSGNEFGTYGNETYGNVIGIQNSVEGANTLVVGYSDTVAFGCTNSFIAGAHNRVNGINSFAIGGMAKTLGAASISLGYYLKTQNDNTVVIGRGLKGNNSTPSKFLVNSHQNTLMVGFHSTKPTLTVGPSPNDYPNGDRFDLTGKVAIGNVPVPEIAAKLHIRSDAGEDAGIFLEPRDMSTASTFIKLRDDSHGFWVDHDGVMTLKSMNSTQYAPLFISGKVGINVSNPNKLVSGYALCVHGGIITEKVNIQSYSDWPDYVFTPDYVLMSLSQLKGYIMEHRHLPDIPSEQEVLDQGVEVGEMQGLLLKKIEELTLYSIQLQEQVELLQKEIEGLKNK